jgi:predicted enzyme related to lactoylglutathione lyase
MIENRSVPPDTILPHVEYQDLAAAIAWRSKTFGFIEHNRYGDPIRGAQLHIGNAWIMVNQADPGTSSPAKLGYGTQSLTVFWVDNIDATLAQVAAHGGQIVASPRSDSPGNAPWIASFRDPAGNLLGLYQEGPRVGTP